MTAWLALAAAAVAAAPAAAPVGVSDAPCATMPAASADVAGYLAARAAAKTAGKEIAPPPAATLQAYNDWQDALRARDFFGLCRYQAENATLPPPGKQRVVFFGDSITELWKLNVAGFFTGDVINRGISGQTTQQMLGRFRADVLDLHPAAVHLMAGTNDIAGNTGPTSLAWIENNIRTMAELARAHGVRVILAAVPPAARFGWRPQLAPAATIAAYDRWLRDYAAAESLTYIDYHALLDDGHGGFTAALAADGVHPNAAGYRLMTERAAQTLARAELR